MARRVVFRDEELLAVQNRRIRRACVVAEMEVEPFEIGNDRTPECRMGYPVEVLVGQVRHASASAEELDEREPFDGTRELPPAPLVNAQHRRKVFDGSAVDVERVGQELADAGVAAGSIHGILVPGRE